VEVLWLRGLVAWADTVDTHGISVVAIQGVLVLVQRRCLVAPQMAGISCRQGGGRFRSRSDLVFMVLWLHQRSALVSLVRC
jgi:hypothetical protein